MATEKALLIGGLSSSQLVETTTSESEVLSGQTFYSGDKTLKTGTMPNNGAVSETLAINGSYTIPAGYHDGNGTVTQSIPTKAATTYGIKSYAQTISSGQYLSGDQTVAAVTQSGLTAANIAKDVTVTIGSNGNVLWSVTGTLPPPFTLSKDMICTDSAINLTISRRLGSQAGSIASVIPAGTYLVFGFTAYKSSTTSGNTSYGAVACTSNVIMSGYDTKLLSGRSGFLGIIKLNSQKTMTFTRAAYPSSTSQSKFYMTSYIRLIGVDT